MNKRLSKELELQYWRAQVAYLCVLIEGAVDDEELKEHSYNWWLCMKQIFVLM